MPEHDCTQEETLNDIDQEIHTLTANVSKQSGWLKAAAGFSGIVILALGSLNGVILGKLTAIEAMLTTSAVVQGRLEERYISLEKRVENIEKRHDTLDMNGVVKVRR